MPRPSSAALTLGQLYHPISNWPHYFQDIGNGKALEWNYVIYVAILGLTQLMLFGFLRKLRLNMLFSFILSLVTSINAASGGVPLWASLEAYRPSSYVQ